MKRFRSLSLCFIASLLLFACAARQKQVTNLPAGVTQQQVQNWDTAVANLDKIAQSTSALRQAVIALNQATVTDSSGTHKVIPDGTVYAAILTSIGKIDQAQIDAAQFLKSQPSNWGATTQTKVKNDIAVITQELQNINAQQLAGVKNAGAQQQIQQLITQLSGFAQVIVALFG